MATIRTGPIDPEREERLREEFLEWAEKEMENFYSVCGVDLETMPQPGLIEHICNYYYRLGRENTQWEIRQGLGLE